MELIRDIFAAGREQKRPVLSFEFFPPKTDEGDRVLFEKTLPALRKLAPDFCSVTYGAGGSTRDKTLGIVERIQTEHGITAMAHLTCVGSTRGQIAEVLEEARGKGIRNILALRGDPPAGTTEFVKTEGGFEYAHELVTFVKERGGFSIGTAGFPEGHMACREGKYADWRHLKAKIEAGADFVITQLFFDNADFLFFRDYLVKKLDVTVPICPGVLPILSAGQIRRFTTMCGARIPESLQTRLESMANDDAAAADFGIEFATRQCEELLREGAPGIHFYTLNKARSVTEIFANLGFGPAS